MLQSAISRSKDELVEFCRQLIRTPSPSGSEEKIAKLIASKMRDLHYDSIEVDDFGSVIGTIEGSSRGRTVIFDGHMDTVDPGDPKNWHVDPYSAKVIGGSIYGRGACDMKGGLASIIFAGAIVKRSERLNGKLVIACVVHEEPCEGFGIRKVIEKIGEPDYIVLGEATNLDLAVGHRGRAEIEIETHGRTAHGSMPDRGVNAIHMMLPVIERIMENVPNLPSHRFLGKATASINRVSCSPDQSAVVPDRCRITVDRRTILGETKESLIAECKRYLKHAKAKGEVRIPATRLNCYTGKSERVELYFPAWVLNREEEVIRKARTALKSVLKRFPKLTKWQFSTDGNYTAGLRGIPTIGFGPGDERFAHTPNDHVPINDLVLATKCYCALAISLCA